MEYEETQAPKKRRISHATLGNNCNNKGSTNCEKSLRHHTPNATASISTYLQLNIKNCRNRNKLVETSKRVEHHIGNGAQPNHKKSPQKEPVAQTTTKISGIVTPKKTKHKYQVPKRTPKKSVIDTNIHQEPVLQSTAAEHPVFEKVDTDTPVTTLVVTRLSKALNRDSNTNTTSIEITKSIFHYYSASKKCAILSAYYGNSCRMQLKHHRNMSISRIEF